MRLDLASFKMEYEAERDRMLAMPIQLWHPPEGLPVETREAFLRGYQRGMEDAAEFDPQGASAPPSELAGEFERAWRDGYEDGAFGGRWMREYMWSTVTSRWGLW